MPFVKSAEKTQHYYIEKYKGKNAQLIARLKKLKLPYTTGRGNNFTNARVLSEYKLAHADAVTRARSYPNRIEPVIEQPNSIDVNYLQHLNSLEDMYNSVPDNSYAVNFFRTVDEVEDLNMHNLHMKTIDLDKMSDLYMKLFGDKFMDLINKTNPGAHILIKMNVSDIHGNETEVYRTLTADNLNWFRKLFKHQGSYIDFEHILPGSDADWLDNEVKVHSITVIDYDQLPEYERKKIHKTRMVAFWPYLLINSPWKLDRYQVFSRVMDIDKTPCLIYALRQAGVDETLLHNIQLDLTSNSYIQVRAIEQIAKKYKLNIHLYIAEDKRTRPVQKFEFGNNIPIKLATFKEHIFLKETIPFNFQYFKYRNEQFFKELTPEQQLLIKTYKDKQPEFYTEVPSFDSLLILRKLLLFKAFVPITLDQAIELTQTEIKFQANPIEQEFIRYHSDSDNPICKIYNKIPNLYKVSGSTQQLINKCIRGGRVLISKKQHVREAVVDLDINSLYPYAITICGVQTGIPKAFSDRQIGCSVNSIVSDVNIKSAYMLINVIKINKLLKYPVISDLHLGELYVDLITLKDLVTYHQIEAKLVSGIYYDSEIDYSLTPKILELYADRTSNPEYKLVLNKIYGFALKKCKDTLNIKLLNEAELNNYIHRNYHKISKITKNNDGTYDVEIYKRFKNHFNLANFGVSILSTARHIINSIIYNLEEHGVEVLYSCTDSIFIKLADIDKFNSLYPHMIGTELGQMKVEALGTEAIFIKKGQYMLKLIDGGVRYRAARVKKDYILELGIEKFYFIQLAE